MSESRYNIWWGPPKKFSTHVSERKISWLELFYDLVYVIVISRVTHYLAANPTSVGLLDYSYMFAMTFWSWSNGSVYYDVHGSPGVRTRFMTLWQMMAVGALATTLDSPPEYLIERATYALMFLQLFITYLWWSVGLYDAEHRKLDRPYTICYLLSFALLGISLAIPLPYKRIVFWVALMLNYLPFGLMAIFMKKRHEEFYISPSMAERLGLLSTIVFGEAILGVVESVGHLAAGHIMAWVRFGLGILIVFALWWISFSVVADREAKKTMWSGYLLLAIYVPALASLGLLGATFPALIERLLSKGNSYTSPLHMIFGVSIALGLCCISLMGNVLVYPEEYRRFKMVMQPLLIITAGVNLLLMWLFPLLSVFWYLLLVFASLLIVVVVLTRVWYWVELNKEMLEKV